MIQKKITVSLLASAMIMAAGAITSFAAPADLPVCTTADCSLSSEHTHDGVSYRGHSADDGHTYHQNCSVQDCTDTKAHTHDGVCYGGHSAGDGHGGCAAGYSGRSSGGSSDRSGRGHHRSGGHCR